MQMSIIPMIIFSLLAGTLSTMNIWVAKRDHMRFHLNDVYMILLMTSWMVLFDSVYNNKPIFIAMSSVAIVIVVYCIRTQTFISDSQFINGMIPHHSMAITMSEKIKEKSTDPNVVGLANNIIRTQNEEIVYMKNLGY